MGGIKHWSHVLATLMFRDTEQYLPVSRAHALKEVFILLIFHFISNHFQQLALS